MDEVSPLALVDGGLALERSEKKITIRGANLALEKARSTGQADEVAAALIRLAHLHFRQGRYPRTRVLVNEVLRDAPPDSLLRCDALRMLGNCCAELGEPDCAESYYHQAVDLARQLDYHYGLYKCLHSLATNIFWPRGQFDLCLAAGKEAFSQAQALHLGEELWFPLSDIAWVYWSTGQRKLAGQIADQMERVVCPGSLGEGFYCCLRAGLRGPGEGDLSAVLALYDRARSIAEATGDPGLNVEVRLGLCRTYRGEKDLPAAAAWAEDAVAVTVRMNYRQFQSLALIERARIALEQGDRQKANADLIAAVEIALALRANFDLARAYFYLAVLEETPGPFLLEALRRIQAGGYIFLLDEESEISYPLLACGLSAPDVEIRQRTANFLKDLQAMPARPLQIQTLGGLHVQVGTRRIEKKVLGQRRADELLVLLLLAPDTTLTFEQISEALWPEKNPESTRAHFHQACSKLRYALEPELSAQDLPSRYLFVENGRVCLQIPAGSWVDIHDFYALCRQGEWESALNTVQGDFLPEYPYAEWLFMERQRISPLIQQALFMNAQQCIQSGQFSAGLDAVRRLLALEPWHEQAVLLGMQACMALEDKTGARRLYKQLEKTLSEELGTQPHADLGAYFQRINARKR